jgi:uncharacterized SAM-binding protein YcdF (DUF218 family)
VRFTRSKIVFFILLVFISAVYIGGCRRAGTWLVTENVPPQADAMVLLMGSLPDRVLQAADLYNEGRTGKIIIVTEYMGPYGMLSDRGVEILSFSTQARNSLIALKVPADSITMLTGEARSTMTEARVVRDYLLQHPAIESMIIVSSPSHMRRASMIFRSALKYYGMPVSVGCSPSVYSGFNPQKWWKRKEDIQTVMTEYLKITSFVLFEKRGLKGDRPLSNRTN